MTSRPSLCEWCGRVLSVYHQNNGCPLRLKEHEQRLKHAEAEHQARLRAIQAQKDCAA
jgi:hypothetical protein